MMLLVLELFLENLVVCLPQITTMATADTDTLQQQVQQLFEDDKHEQALIVIDKILELDPNSAQTHYKKGNILQLLGQYEASIDAYENASNVNPDHPGTYYNMGIAYDEIGLHGVRFSFYLTSHREP